MPATNKNVRRQTRVRIEGRVQGVGFRMFVAREAQARLLQGYVRNRRDGGVEAVFAGTSDAIDDVIEQCRRGPRGAVVAMLKAFDDDEPLADGFNISATV